MQNNTINSTGTNVAKPEQIAEAEFDTDDLSPSFIFSLHKRVLKRCGTNKYQAPHRSTLGNKCFVIITTSLTLVGITYGFWFKNFSDFSNSSVH